MALISGVQRQSNQGTNVSVNGRMADHMDKAPIPLKMETNTSVNGSMANTTGRAPLPLVLRVNGQETNTSVTTRMANDTEKEPIPGELGRMLNPMWVSLKMGCRMDWVLRPMQMEKLKKVCLKTESSNMPRRSWNDVAPE